MNSGNNYDVSKKLAHLSMNGEKGFGGFHQQNYSISSQPRSHHNHHQIGTKHSSIQEDLFDLIRFKNAIDNKYLLTRNSHFKGMANALALQIQEKERAAQLNTKNLQS